MLTRRALLAAAVGGAVAAGVSRQPDASTVRLAGGTYNMKVHRDPYAARVFLGHWARTHGLDFVLLQELTGYHAAVREIPGYRLVAANGWPGASNTGVLVRDGVRADRRRAVRTSGRWLRRDGVSWHPPRTWVGCRLDGWLSVLSVHMPPRVDVHGAHLHGPALSQRAYAGCAERLAKLPGWDLLGGDWNEGTRPRGRYSPRWVARRRGWRLHPAPGVDFAMAGPGIVVDRVHVDDGGGSDHRAVRFRVTSP